MPRTNQKLGFKFFGPFQVTDRIGKVAYRLALPVTSNIHPVVHVSQLKLAEGFKGTAVPNLPTNIPQFRVPLKVLRSRLINRVGSQLHQSLIQWSGLPVELATWEDYEALKQFFPSAPAWGQAGSQGGGNVSITPTEEEEDGAQNNLGRGKRAKKPNSNIVGPSWAN